MLSKQTTLLITGAFSANGVELSQAGLMVIEVALAGQDETLIRKAVTNALQSGKRMSLAEINKQLSDLKGENVSKRDATALAERAYALLRFPQRDGSRAAQSHDPDAYALLMQVGSWYDVHNRSENDQRQLRQDLKDLAPKAIKESRQAMLEQSQVQALAQANEIKPRPSLDTRKE